MTGSMMTQAAGRLKKRIEEIIWSQVRRNPPLSLETGLLLASKVYGALAAGHRAVYRLGLRKVKRLDCKVVSIGNLAVGGTGKTPFVRRLACMLKGRGMDVAVISRGYKGGNEKSGTLVSNRDRVLVSARQAGDEPWLLARTLPGVPVAAGRDRYALGRMLEAGFAPDVIILDDGMQHHRLFKDLEIVLLDGESPLGNGYLLPRGPLRESPRALARAEMAVFTFKGCQGPGSVERLPHAGAGRKTYKAVYRPVVLFTVTGGRREEQHWPDLCNPDSPEDRLPDLPVFAFSALARSRDFGAAVAAMGARVVGELTFSDHHWFSRADVERICRQALAANAEMMVTTAKDFARLAEKYTLPMDLIVVDLVVDLAEDTPNFEKTVIAELMVG